MKNKSNLLLLSALLGGLLFSFLFWKERLALNLLIYSVYILIITYVNPDIIKSQKFKIYGATHLLAAFLVLINNSDLSLVSYYISLLLFIGYSHNQKIRTVFTSFGAAILQMVTVPLNAIKTLAEVKIGNFNFKPVFKLVKYVFIPLVIVTIFTCLYSAANSVFAHYAETILTSISELIENTIGLLFKDLSALRFIHFCLGLLVTSGLVIAFFDKSLQNAESNCKEQLLRVRKNAKYKSIWRELLSTFSFSLLDKKLALKTEYITALISFIALNILLLLLNSIDIVTIWFGYKPSGNFSADLHDGTNALIFSIAMAMGIIIYFFRGNLNFYSKSKTLRFLAFVWMLQNLILIVSVFIRDGYYIEFYGLTYKRIGVIIFAILCIIGLTTVYLKVSKQKTLFYLLKVNGNIWFALLLAFSVVNWDVFIAKYNLSQQTKISLDAGYLLTLSDKTLPILEKNREKLHFTEGTDINDRTYAKPETAEFYQHQLDMRISFFKERYKKVSWLSWNLQDWKTAEYFNIPNKN
ncbi:DUF4173 domain-containing protein [Pedobacter lithocola]|uniref:DUF4173 domain-containing protein n=1 Tax=Pedobacter lithocola TaxID=1908239 RepID=A0ABV8PAK3_9SPHI